MTLKIFLSETKIQDQDEHHCTERVYYRNYKKTLE